MTLNVGGIIKTAEIDLNQSLMVSFGAHMLEFAFGIEKYHITPEIENIISSECQKKALSLFKLSNRMYAIAKTENIPHLELYGILP